MTRPTPKRFAQLEARTAALAYRRLSNCAASIDGVDVDAIFASPGAAGQVGTLGMATSRPALALPTQQVSANAVGQHVRVNGQRYLIAEAMADGTGETHLMLELA